MTDGESLTINLFPNEGENLLSIVEVDGRRVAVTPSQFLEGWQGHRPPFSNGEVRVPGSISAGRYEAAAWANDEVRARWLDASGRAQNVIVEKRGQPFSRPGDPSVPDMADRSRLVYVNLRLKLQRGRGVNPDPAPVSSRSPAPALAAVPGDPNDDPFDF
tara:strand:+ start:259 stop:738 length:480 start_codon:yes stop_codon:yes gene_type:complete